MSLIKISLASLPFAHEAMCIPSAAQPTGLAPQLTHWVGKTPFCCFPPSSSQHPPTAILIGDLFSHHWNEQGRAAPRPHVLPNSIIGNFQYVKNNTLKRSTSKEEKHSMVSLGLKIQCCLQDGLSESLWQKPTKRIHFHLNLLKATLLAALSLYS